MSRRRLRRSLLDGEEVVLVTRLHGSRLIRPLLTLGVLAAAGVRGALWLREAGLQDRLLTLAEVGGAALLVLLALRPLRRILQWRSRRFVLTTHRLLQVWGGLRRHISSVPLGRVSDVDLRRSLLGRLLGYGELGVLSGGRVHRIGPLPRPKSIHAAVLAALRPPVVAAPPREEFSPVEPEPQPLPEAPSSPQPVFWPAALELGSPGEPESGDEGSVFGGRYRPLRELATGGMGTVYEGRDERLGRPVAIKLLREGAGAGDSIERFRREARSAASLSHPNIASLFDYGEEDGVPYMVMELVRGSDLSHVLGREGSFDPRRAAGIALQVLRALDHAHETGVIHRDVKPANVILEREDHVKVTDFGIARAAGQTTLTAAGALVGSAPYISPEQASGHRVLPQSDIYSAGILLFEMLTGEPPFTGHSAFAIVRKHLSEEVPPPSSFTRRAPKALDRIVARATAKDPSDRFRSAGQMAVALARWLDGFEVGRTRTPSRTLRLSDNSDFDTPPLLG